MPIRHTDKGWYWGSKGPFATKAKALSVARAAYASGYKENEETEMNHEPCKELLATLMCGQIHLRVMHWNTTSFAQHEALGKLYDSLADLTDELAEVYMGIYGRIGAIPCEVLGTKIPVAKDYVEMLASVVESSREQMPNDSQIQNILDEIAATIDKTNYLLTLE